MPPELGEDLGTRTHSTRQELGRERREIARGLAEGKISKEIGELSGGRGFGIRTLLVVISNMGRQGTCHACCHDSEDDEAKHLVGCPRC